MHAPRHGPLAPHDRHCQPHRASTAGHGAHVRRISGRSAAATARAAPRQGTPTNPGAAGRNPAPTRPADRHVSYGPESQFRHRPLELVFSEEEEDGLLEDWRRRFELTSAFPPAARGRSMPHVSFKLRDLDAAQPPLLVPKIQFKQYSKILF